MQKLYIVIVSDIDTALSGQEIHGDTKNKSLQTLDIFTGLSEKDSITRR